ncbi:BCCT family transporter [Oceanirhabdus sp. W0125-5]|uniref:BCCT family transporter n=1 Tax=Oceanirhabdus sp. W0125-5 TaxID=2999116 RepID=UPI0022F2F6D8|nr:BCCT family transporter [Oceanirhabdus sp. W0125-5]WBW97466.1 BCCT family transporter [Oceanirhabdus sp. W0125-5]
MKKENVKNKTKASGLFWIAAGFTAIFSVWAVVNPSSLTNTLWDLVYKFHGTFNWFTIVLPLVFLVICFYLAFSKYGKIKLGPKDEKPEFSTFSWIGMLFTAGIGVGLVNFGVAEPMVHYLSSPLGLAGGYEKAEAAKNALMLSLFNWGLPAWTIYTLSGLVIGYFTYHRGAKFLPGTPIEEGFKDKKWGKTVGQITNIAAASAAALTMAASIGMGVFQVKNGVQAITGKQFPGLTSSLVILFILFVVYTVPAILPVKKGMKVLGDLNVVIAIGLLLFVFSFGPTRYFMETILTTLGTTVTKLIPQSFNTYVFQDKGWFNDWPLTTLIWWISWTPFMGVFIARISKGRTLRQFITASILIPTAFLVFWFCVFGGFGLLNDIAGDGAIAKYVTENPNDVYLSFIMVLQSLPLFAITGPIFVILIVVFLATGATSAAISLSMMTSDGAENAPIPRTIIWSIIMVTISFANVVTGTLSGVKAVAVFLGVPYVFFVILQVTGLIRQLRNDYRKGLL